MSADTIASLYKSMGIGKRRPRQSPVARRKEIATAQVASLERVLADIQQKARASPEWAKAYFSAATSVELEIALIRKESA